MKTRALYAGSFDPFTTGHESIVRRSLAIFDEVVIAIGHNERKRGEWPVEYRRRAIERLYASEPRVSVMTYTGLTVDAARDCGATVMVRGVRDAADFGYERTLADTNRAIGGPDTVMLASDAGLGFVSSSMVRELLHFGHDAGKYIAWKAPDDEQC